VVLTEGEPLLVRYYAEDLWQFIGKGARVTRADLDGLKPGFDSYFKRWFDLQEKLWQVPLVSVRAFAAKIRSSTPLPVDDWSRLWIGSSLGIQERTSLTFANFWGLRFFSWQFPRNSSPKRPDFGACDNLAHRHRRRLVNQQIYSKFAADSVLIRHRTKI